MQIVLGSRSPRRRELLESVVGVGRLTVHPPLQSDEQGFENLTDRTAIRQRLTSIVDTKMAQVMSELAPVRPSVSAECCLVTADTIVVVDDQCAGTRVLGQPGSDHWRSEVRDWMLRFYSAGTHEVWTGFRLTCGERAHEQIVTTQVRFCKLNESLVDRYLATEESVGKAGGYAIQGAAAAFVEGIKGSLTNVIGLPLMEVVRAMESIGVQIPDVERQTGIPERIQQGTE
ncbi:MAG: Maf family protein [Planctomycetaceae bacterium]